MNLPSHSRCRGFRQLVVLALAMTMECGAAFSAALPPSIQLKADVLAALPARRQAALLAAAVSDRDSTPQIAEKNASYIAALGAMIADLKRTYYWHAEFPLESDKISARRAAYLVALRYPASPSTGASFYGNLMQSYTIKLLEEEIITIARAVSERAKAPDIVVTGGAFPAFEDWRNSWEAASEAIKRNQRGFVEIDP